MAFDDEGLARRSLAANAFSATTLQELIPIADPERYFSGRGWRRDITDDDKLVLYRRALATLGSYGEKASLCKRPEEVDPDWLYAPVWPVVNRHYAHLGSVRIRSRSWSSNSASCAMAVARAWATPFAAAAPSPSRQHA